MTETRKLAAILVADIVGYSRLTGADEELTLARLRTLRSDLIDPTIAIHNGRVIKRTGDGAFVEFRSVVEAVRCAMEVRSGLAERNAGLPADKRIEARVGIHLGDVVEETDGDLMGDGVNVAARLEGICEPGCVCLSAAAYEQVRDKLHVTFVDLGEKSLKNIERPVRAYMLRAAEDGAAGRQAATAASRLRLSALQWAAIAVAFLAVLIAAGWFGPRVFAPSAPPPPPVASVQERLTSEPRLSIVVLPFANLSGDPEQDYFADGLSDDLTTDLSNLPDSFVIAHTTALTYKGKAVDAKEIGRELGVRHAVEGSVRRVGETITVNAQLISTETGAHVWADRFEGDRGKLGELQVEAVARIANALGVQLLQAESLRAMRERPTNPDAVDLTMRGWTTLIKSISPGNVNEAIGYFDQALGLDPDLPQALIGKAQARIINLYAFQIGDWNEVLRDAEQAADRVLASQPNKSALYTKAQVLSGRGQYEATLANLDAVIAIDRNFANAYAEKRHTLVMLGRVEEAIKPVEQALRLDPRSPVRNVWEWYMCDAYAHLAEWEKVIDSCQKSVASNPSLMFPYIELAAANGWMGRPAEASAAVAELQKLKPSFTVQDYLALPHPDNAKWMGSGKTEAAIILAHRLMKNGSASGIYFALPTMATADALYARIAAIFRRLFDADTRPSLVLAHGARNLNPQFIRSINLAERRGDDEGDYGEDANDETASAACARWLADDRRKTFLADVGVGTVDQALLAVLPVKHAAVRQIGLAQRVLIIDEAHAYDAYMQREIEALIEHQARLKAPVIVLSATLPSTIRNRLASAYGRGRGILVARGAGSEYPLATAVGASLVEAPLRVRDGLARDISVRRLESESEAEALMVEAARGGAAAAYIRNTVDDAIASAERIASVGVQVELFHARFAMGDRLTIEHRAVDLFGKKGTPEDRRGKVLVATQVAEQSLDLDFDVMVSDLAPVDLLLQRAGRIWRHGREGRGWLRPELNVVSPSPNEDADKFWYARLFPRGQWVYRDHALLWLSAQELFAREAISSPRDLRRLVEAVYAPDALERSPPDLRASGATAAGTASAHRGIATLNLLDLDAGYSPRSGVWGPDTVTPTRLGEERVILRLARVEAGRLVPWIGDDDPRRAWALSEVSIRAKRFASRGDLSAEIEAQARALDEVWMRNGVPAVAAPLIRAGEDWLLPLNSGGKANAKATYSIRLGLRWVGRG